MVEKSRLLISRDRCRRSHVRHEQRGPETVFSASAFPHEQFKADFSPQEHLAWDALRLLVGVDSMRLHAYQTQASPLLPQQVLGVAAISDLGQVGSVRVFSGEVKLRKIAVFNGRCGTKYSEGCIYIASASC